MACYHPLKGFPVGLTANGKTKYKVTEWNVKSVTVWPDGRITKNYDDMVSSPSDHKLGISVVSDFQKLPCGTCRGCRMAASRSWADRCMLELGDHENSAFLTLTYDDDHIKNLDLAYNGDTGEYVGENLYSLRKSDLQKFHKDLRQALVRLEKPKIRFFACGEYGDAKGRCHFHDIVFGLDVPDKKFYRNSKSGFPVYTSKWLKEIWKNGDVFVGAVSWSTAAYTARYVMKKIGTGANDYYTRNGLVPPFVVMSRRPGIAAKYYENHPELFNFRSIALSTDSGLHEAFPPRYFKKKLAIDDPDRYNEITELNKLSMDLKEQAKMAQTDMDYLDLLAAEEELLNNRTRNLERKEF